jgi:hypothetical protein
VTAEWAVVNADCGEFLKTLPAESFDSLVTDPPAGIGFMGKAWDSDKGGRGAWIGWLTGIMQECLRVLKPGGHGLVWALPRTSHWTATALEDAGFEIRDVVTHHFGTGFPKSLDVSKAIDKQRDDRESILAVTEFVRIARDNAGKTNKDIDAAFNTNGMAGHWTSSASQPAIPTWEQWLTLKEVLVLGDSMDPEVWRLNGRKGAPGEAYASQEVLLERTMIQGGGNYLEIRAGERREVSADITLPALASAKQWAGWGTALKPATEHWILVRKPLDGTVAANVQRHGTGALNIDGCRIGTSKDVPASPSRTAGRALSGSVDGTLRHETGQEGGHDPNIGRWPANLVLTHGPDCGDECAEGCPVAELDGQSVGKTEDTVGASRFFYVPKPSRRERGEGNTHPTVKAKSLMEYLIRLVTPAGGLILDPFCGSGSTGVAASSGGWSFLGIEQSAEFAKIAEGRIAAAAPPSASKAA